MYLTFSHLGQKKRNKEEIKKTFWHLGARVHNSVIHPTLCICVQRIYVYVGTVLYKTLIRHSFTCVYIAPNKNDIHSQNFLNGEITKLPNLQHINELITQDHLRL